MYKFNIQLFLLLFLSSISFSQSINQNYKILFSSECSMPDAMDLLYNTYSIIAGDSNVYDLKIEKYNFNFGKITLLLDNEPSSAQIYELYKNKNLVSFELRNNKVINERYNDFIEKYKSKRNINMQQLPNYELILKYKFESHLQSENRDLYKIFGTMGSFEKDANELEISLPEKKSNKFIEMLKENVKVVYLQKQ